MKTASSQLTLQTGNIIDENDIALAEIIRSETEFIDQLITRTRQLIELEDLEFKQIDLLHTTKDVLTNNQKIFGQNVNVTIQSDDAGYPVFGDTGLLEIALDEIIQNGFEAGGDITVEIEKSDNITLMIQNRLTDQMYDTLNNKSLDITEPYISLKPNKIGLGLSIASKIISLHDGIIETALDANRGMIVKIILPRPTHPHPVIMEKSGK